MRGLQVPLLQRLVRAGRRIVPRGWFPLIRAAAQVLPSLRRYRAVMNDGDVLVLDLRESMCHGYLIEGEIRHERGVETLIRTMTGPDAVFIDVGANVGYYARRASRIVGPFGVVYAFEPAPATIELLRANVSALPNVTVRAVALGNQRGEVDFFVRRHGDTSSLGASPDARRVRVPQAKLDTELADIPRMDFLKIDVEGFELEVLLGAVGLIGRHRPAICFEFAEGYSRMYGKTIEDFEAFFRPFDYDLRRIANTSREEELYVGPFSNDIIAVPRPRNARKALA